MTQILSFDEDSIMTSEIIAVIESRGALIEKLFDAYSTRALTIRSHRRCLFMEQYLGFARDFRICPRGDSPTVLRNDE